MLLCVVVRVTVCHSVSWCEIVCYRLSVCENVSQSVTMCYRMRLCVVVRCSVFQRGAVCFRVFQYVSVRGGGRQGVEVCSKVLV